MGMVSAVRGSTLSFTAVKHTSAAAAGGGTVSYTHLDVYKRQELERVNAICRHPLWRDSVRQIAHLERDRQFCRHDLVHFLDVARLAYIENLERGLGVDKELIYAAALLHDIGRHLQYTRNIPHDQASAQLAEVILTDCGFSQAERTEVEDAILQHRGQQDRQREGLAGLLYGADKASRACLFCPAEPECNWSPEKKNMRIKA